MFAKGACVYEIIDFFSWFLFVTQSKTLYKYPRQLMPTRSLSYSMVQRGPEDPASQSALMDSSGKSVQASEQEVHKNSWFL